MAARSNSDLFVASESTDASVSVSASEPFLAWRQQCSEIVCIGDLVDALPVVLPPQTSIQAAVQAMQKQPLSCVVVAMEGTILGLFTEQEVLDCVAAGVDTTTTTIGLAIVPQVPILRPDASLEAAFQAMQAACRRYLLVVDDQGQICGLVSHQRLDQALGDSQTADLRATDESGDPALRSPIGSDAILAYGLEDPSLGDLESSPQALTPDRSLAILTYIHYQLLGLEEQNRLRVFSRCLKLLGRVSQAQGAALFETHLDGDGKPLTSLRTAWHLPGANALDQGSLQNLPPSQLQRWHEVLSRGGLLSGIVGNFPTTEQSLLGRLGGDTVLILPLRCHGQYFGFLVFSRTSDGNNGSGAEGRMAWPSAIVKLLRTVAISLSLACEQHTMQSCLRQTQNAFASLFHHSPDPMAVTTFPEGRHLLVNASYARWLGRPSAEIVGRRPADLGLIHNRRQFAHLRRHLRDRGCIKNIEIDSHLVNGQTRTLLVSSELTQLNDQTCLLSVGKDITERKAILATLRAAEARFRAIFEQIDVGICQANLNGGLVDVNPGICRMLGFSREELLAKNFADFTHPDDLALDLGHYQQLLVGNSPSFSLEKRYCHKNGSPVWVALTVCLVRDSDGQPLFSIGVSQDISERKRSEAERQSTEQALQISHQRINNILESITDAFFALDQNWRFIYLNQRAEQFLRRSRHEVLGQNLWYEFPEVLGTQVSRQLRRAMVERVSLTFEADMAPVDRWYEFHVYPTQEGLAVYFQDITSRRRAYEQIEHQIRR
ncbi:MAG: PAS domain S-box protein, partial [Nodosilinea sp.]